MAYATKTKGYRLITVEGTKYRWRLRMGDQDTTITLQSSITKSGQQAHAIFSGYPHHEWIPMFMGNSLIATPSLVSQVIKHAFSLGWKPEAKAAPLQFIYPHKKQKRKT